MPEMDGVEATRHLMTVGDRCPRVLILTTFDLDEYIVEALRAGAAGFLLKDAPPDELLHAIRVVAAGDALLAPCHATTPGPVRQPAAAGRGSPAPRGPEFAERERQVLRLVATGLTNAEIAERTYTSARRRSRRTSRGCWQARCPRPGARGRGRVRDGARRSRSAVLIWKTRHTTDEGGAPCLRSR